MLEMYSGLSGGSSPLIVSEVRYTWYCSEKREAPGRECERRRECRSFQVEGFAMVGQKDFDGIVCRVGLRLWALAGLTLVGSEEREP